MITGSQIDTSDSVHGMTKNDRYKWRIVDEKGAFEWVDKSALQIDRSYQRQVSKERISRLSQEWSWVSCGCLIVCMRPDGTLWVVDGQHRKLAADKKADIRQLPCMIFSGDRDIEAKGFLSSNVNRKPLTMLDKLPALVESGDAVAKTMSEFVASRGYRFASGKADKNLSCTSMLYKMFGEDQLLAENVFDLAIAICEPTETRIQQDLLGGLFHLEQVLRKKLPGESLFRSHNTEKLKLLGGKKLSAEINTFSALRGMRTSYVSAEAICQAINKNRSGRRISVFGGAEV